MAYGFAALGSVFHSGCGFQGRHHKACRGVESQTVVARDHRAEQVGSMAKRCSTRAVIQIFVTGAHCLVKQIGTKYVCSDALVLGLCLGQVCAWQLPLLPSHLPLCSSSSWTSCAQLTCLPLTAHSCLFFP